VVFDFSKDIVLEDKRALLTPIIVQDIIHLKDIATEDAYLLKYSPSQIHTPALLASYVNSAIHMRENKIRYTFTVWDKMEQAFAGSTSFLNISEADDRLEIGATWYGRKFQRTGLNRHCKFLLLSYAFEVLKAVRVEFRTDERNTDSRTAIEKIGGIYEGTLRTHMLMPDGHRRNTACYSILNSEWMDLKNKFPVA